MTRLHQFPAPPTEAARSPLPTKFHTLRPLRRAELEELARIQHSFCGTPRCLASATWVAAYALTNHRGWDQLVKRRLCPPHARSFAQSHQLPFPEVAG